MSQKDGNLLFEKDSTRRNKENRLAEKPNYGNDFYLSSLHQVKNKLELQRRTYYVCEHDCKTKIRPCLQHHTFKNAALKTMDNACAETHCNLLYFFGLITSRTLQSVPYNTSFLFISKSPNKLFLFEGLSVSLAQSVCRPHKSR